MSLDAVGRHTGAGAWFLDVDDNDRGFPLVPGDLVSDERGATSAPRATAGHGIDGLSSTRHLQVRLDQDPGNGCVANPAQLSREVRSTPTAAIRRRPTDVDRTIAQQPRSHHQPRVAARRGPLRRAETHDRPTTTARGPQAWIPHGRPVMAEQTDADVASTRA